MSCAAEHLALSTEKSMPYVTLHVPRQTDEEGAGMYLGQLGMARRLGTLSLQQLVVPEQKGSQKEQHWLAAWSLAVLSDTPAMQEKKCAQTLCSLLIK